MESYEVFISGERFYSCGRMKWCYTSVDFNCQLFLRNYSRLGCSHIKKKSFYFVSVSVPLSLTIHTYRGVLGVLRSHRVDSRGSKGVHVVLPSLVKEIAP